MGLRAPAHLLLIDIEQPARRLHRIDAFMRLGGVGGTSQYFDMPAHASLAGAHHAQLRRLAGNAHFVALGTLHMMGDAGEAEFLI